MLIAAGCLVISYIMYASGIEGGAIFALISFAMLICFIVGLIYLIAGFLGKEEITGNRPQGRGRLRCNIEVGALPRELVLHIEMEAA